jgi:dolichol kinase
MAHSPLADIPAITAWNTVATFNHYEVAQRAVGRLSDDGFPVGALDIVGSDLRLVERVTGRLTKARAAAAGALSGMWIGLIIGILLGLFAPGHAWPAVIATGLGLGALVGASFGFAAHFATRGKRDFKSVRGLAAAHYDLIARDTRYAERAGPC